MKAALVQFQINIDRVRHLGQIYSSLSNLPASIDLTDILRAEYVSVVSAFDYLIHEFTRLGMLEIFQKKRIATDAYSKFRVPIQRFEDALINPSSHDWLEAEIRIQHGFLSFQKADKVADALRLVSDKSLWSEVAALLGQDAKNIKQELNLIVDRRNKIAHEADMDPSYPDQRWPIDEPMVNKTIDFLFNIADAIHEVIQ